MTSTAKSSDSMLSRMIYNGTAVVLTGGTKPALRCRQYSGEHMAGSILRSQYIAWITSATYTRFAWSSLRQLATSAMSYPSALLVPVQFVRSQGPSVVNVWMAARRPIPAAQGLLLMVAVPQLYTDVY